MTLVLALESPPAPGLKKKAERLLKLNKPLPFNRIMLMVEGEEAEDVVDPETGEIQSPAIQRARSTRSRKSCCRPAWPTPQRFTGLCSRT